MRINITDCGAVADGVTNNAAAIQTAIDTCERQGGGTVVVPAGRFLSGTIVLKSHVELHLEHGSVLVQSHNPEEIKSFNGDVSSSASNGMDGAQDGSFLYACYGEDIAITGTGTIDGRGREVYFDDDTDGGFHESPLAVKGFRPRTSYLEDIDGLTVKDITFFDSCFWTLHMAGCRNVLVDGIRIRNNDRGPNNDGIDPDSCQHVIIRGCMIETGDDAIVLKTTKPITEKYGDCEDIVITGCVLHSRDSALKIGTETWGSIRDVIFADCVIKDCSRGAGLWVRDGGTIERVHIHHIAGTTRRYAEFINREKPTGWWGKGEPLFLSAAYRNEEKRFPGCIRNIRADHLDITGEAGFFFAADKDGIIEDITVTDSRLRLERRSRHTPEYYDEQPSPQSVYRAPLSWYYNRGAERVKLDCELEMDAFMENYFSRGMLKNGAADGLDECPAG